MISFFVYFIIDDTLCHTLCGTRNILHEANIYVQPEIEVS